MYWTRHVVTCGTQREHDNKYGYKYRFRNIKYEGWAKAENLTNRHYIGLPIDNDVIAPQPIWHKQKSGRGERKEDVLRVPEEFHDEEWWWAFGCWWGDGNINQDYIEFSVADKDKIILERLLNLGIKYDRNPSIIQLQGCKKVRISNAVIARWLKGWQRGNSEKQPPEWVERIDTKYQRELLNGYFDAAGTNLKNGRSLTSIYLPGLLSLRRIASRLGVACSIYYGNENEYIRESPNGEVRKCSESYVLQHKYQINSPLPYTFIDNGYLWTLVKNIKKVDGRVFIPLNTENEVYLTHFGLSHNCILDYHGLFEDADRGGTETERQKNLSKAFKKIAVRNNIPVIDVAAVTMQDGHNERAPELSEIAWSKQLGYDADLVLAVHRAPESKIFEIQSRKSRRGVSFAFYLQWDLNTGAWSEFFDV